jgi:ubiquinone/menaquinone biosynthesis C-methylase UbiE
MDDPEKVVAYTRAGRENGVMAPVYLFHCAQICTVFGPGETVVDLGCGPATQLALVARLNPGARFIGVDMSEEMLDRARTYIEELQLTNVSFRQGDITNLDFLPEGGADAICSTVALHHLPTVTDLERTFAGVARVLKPAGGLYLVDFGHLRAEKSIEYFAYQYQGRQPELFTLDYLYSLRAAFDLADFRQATRSYLQGRAKVFSTFLMPFMVAIKSMPRRKPDPVLKRRLLELRRQLPPHHQTDLQDLKTFFRLGGLRTELL